MGMKLLRHTLQSTMKQRLVCAKCSEYFTFSVFSPAFSFQYRSIDVMREREREKVHGKNANCTPSVQRFRTISMVMQVLGFAFLFLLYCTQ